jgi:hypothetical protein
MANIKSAPKAPVIVKDLEHPEDDQILAASILRVSRAFTKLQEGGLNRKAIVALIHDDSSVSKTIIKRILDSLDDLEKNYCV